MLFLINLEIVKFIYLGYKDIYKNLGNIKVFLKSYILIIFWKIIDIWNNNKYKCNEVFSVGWYIIGY